MPASPHTSPQDSPSQFKLRSMFWVTTCLALLLGYARMLGDDALRLGALYFLFAVLAGGVLGSLLGRLFDTLFWSMLTTLLVYLAVAGGRLPSEAVAIGWGVVGAMCGSFNAAGRPRNVWIGSLASGLLAGLSLCGCLLALRQTIVGLIWFDVVCAVLIGGCLRPSIDFLKRLEASSRQPRIVLAAWLSMCILLGNFLVPILGGVQR